MNTTIKTEKTASKPTQQQIAALAYQLWEKGGHRPGRDLEYWFQAEKHLNAASPPAPTQTATQTREPQSPVRGSDGRLRNQLARA